MNIFFAERRTHMKKLLVVLMSLAMLLSLSATAFAADAANTAANPSSVTPGQVDDIEVPDDYYDEDDDDDDEPSVTPTPPAKPVTPPVAEPEPVEEVKVEVKVDTAVDKSGNAVEVSVAAVTAETLAAEQPVVAAKIEESKTAVAEIKQASTPEAKEAAVSSYFDKQGSAAKAAITAAVAASSEVSSLADIEPVVVAPVKVESAAFAEGESVTMTIDMPTEFESYALTENSFVCAELVDANGNKHIVTFQVVDGKLVGDFPAAGVIGNFWVGSSVTAPVTGNTNLEGIVLCGIALCAAALLFSVKRFKRA